MVRPLAKRQEVRYLMEEWDYSQRPRCAQAQPWLLRKGGARQLTSSRETPGKTRTDGILRDEGLTDICLQTGWLENRGASTAALEH